MSDLNVLGTASMGSDQSRVASYNTGKTPDSQISGLNLVSQDYGKNVLKGVPEVNEKVIGEAVEDVNAFMTNMQYNLAFSIDEDSGEPIVFIKDIDTDEVIRQIPSEELVVLRKKLDDVSGILFDTKV